jgi:hypothetical protein
MPNTTPEEHHGMICGCSSCVKLKGGASDVVKGSRTTPDTNTIREILQRYIAEYEDGDVLKAGDDAEAALKAREDRLSHLARIDEIELMQKGWRGFTSWYDRNSERLAHLRKDRT